MDQKKIAIFGASGALGSAFIRQLSTGENVQVHAFSRHVIAVERDNVHAHTVDYLDEPTIERAAEITGRDGSWDLVIVASGVLHGDSFTPEKSLRDLSADSLEQLFRVNTIGPALIAKHFLPRMNRKSRAVFAALSARVGSISDNRLGGWYAYRASKAALNMIIKTASIEIARSKPLCIVAGLHPGTVDSELSRPFQKNVPQGKLFTADYSAEKLLQVIANLRDADTGKVFAWDGKEIES